MRDPKNIFARIDWAVVSLYLILVLLGWVNIYAAVYNEEHQSIFDISQNYGKQLIWIVTSLVIAATILIVDARFLTAFPIPIYLFTLLLLLAVLVFGTVVSGSKSWFTLGAFRIQPAEFAKFATAMALAKYLSMIDIRIDKLRTKFFSSTLIFLPLALILLQGDAGSALVYVSFFFVLYREGLSGNILLGGLLLIALFIITLLVQNTYITFPFQFAASGKTILIAVLSILAIIAFLFFKKGRNIRGAGVFNKQIFVLVFGLLILSIGFIASVDYVFDHTLSPHQRDRINVLIGATSDPKGTGYNVAQSKIAIGSGGFFGKGFLQGTQTKYDFVPEQSTDFIFCTVGEEWGFTGGLLVILLFLALFMKLILVAERQRSKFTRIYAYGVVSILFFHFAVNIGMTIGLAPVIGIPLPFFSYGGSSLWAFTILLFILVKLDAYRLETFR